MKFKCENMSCILWFQQDLRLEDNPALLHISQIGAPFIPLYIFDDTTPPSQHMGDAQKWWLHHSLHRLEEALKKKYGAQLILRKGDPHHILHQLIEETKATHLTWNRRYDPHAVKRDQNIQSSLKNQVNIEIFNGSLLFEPWEAMTQSGTPFQVFTPFYKFCSQNITPRTPESAPETVKTFSAPLKSDALETWDLIPQKPNWAEKFHAYWHPGEEGAHKKLHTFIEEKLAHYAPQRDIPDADMVSRLSPHLHMGEISPHQIAHAVKTTDAHTSSVQKFLSELGWREFAHYILYHFPHTPEKNFNPKFNSFPWEKNPSHLQAWQKGKTGYPIVDAGMRQLWEEGWMHNRLRLIVGSFLTKHLRMDWQVGAAWFNDTLVDADLANNTGSWQWVAGTGVDAAPYFRIFNPLLQSQKFDKEGHFIRKWVPEIKNLPNKYIHAPWEAPEAQLEEAGITLGETYPRPIVDHKTARTRALDAFYKL